MDQATTEHPGALPLGFAWGAVKAGIKASGNLDSQWPWPRRAPTPPRCSRSNQVVAAPVTVGRRHLPRPEAACGAVLVNAGNANCATGAGRHRRLPRDLLRRGRDASAASSTRSSLPRPASSACRSPRRRSSPRCPPRSAALGSTTDHAELFARAIMTTDTRMKVAPRSRSRPTGAQVRIFGAAKGAGMIHPQLGAPSGAAAPHATMLVYLFTDLAAEPAELRAAACSRRSSPASTPSRSTATPRPTTPCCCSPAEQAASR